MKSILCLFAFVSAVSAQQTYACVPEQQCRPDASRVEALATAQSAQTFSFALTAELATALEKLRISQGNEVTTLGVTSWVTTYATVTAMLEARMIEILRQAVVGFPTTAIQTKRTAAAIAATEVKAAEDAVITAK